MNMHYSTFQNKGYNAFLEKEEKISCCVNLREEATHFFETL